MSIFRYPLRLAVTALVVGGLTLGGVALACGPIQMVTRSGNVNSITNLGSGKSNTLIVEGGLDGQVTRSVFIQNEPPARLLPAQPMPPVDEPVPAVPAVPAVPVNPEPVPAQPMEPQPQPVEPQPQPVAPLMPPEIVIRIPVPQPAFRGPVVQIPAIRMPNIEIPALEVPAGRAIVTENAGGRTTVINYGSGRNTSIISSNGKTMVFGDALSYSVRDGRFWSKSMYCQKLECTVYYDPRTTLWFRYHAVDGSYRPVTSFLDWDDE